MNTKQAKDFFVAQAAEQAAIEGLPLADLEKRMMYFTESDPASCPDPLALNDEFEAQFEMGEYEAKIFGLLEHARERLRKEDPGRTRHWDEAVGELMKGDHYILVLLGLAGGLAGAERPKHDSLKLVGTALCVIAILGVLTFVAKRSSLDDRHFREYSRLLLLVLVVLSALSGPIRRSVSGFLARRKQR